MTLPRKGTLIVNTFYLTDSLGARVPLSEMDPGMADDSQYVVASGIAAHGKKDVVVLLGPSHPDSTFLAYEKNGDVYLLNTDRGGEWERLAFGLKKGKHLTTPIKRLSGSSLGKKYKSKDHNEVDVLGIEKAVVGERTVDATHLRMVMVMKYQQDEVDNSPEATFKNAMNYWFSPALGYFTRISFGWGGKYFLNQQLKRISMP